MLIHHSIFGCKDSFTHMACQLRKSIIFYYGKPEYFPEKILYNADILYYEIKKWRVNCTPSTFNTRRIFRKDKMENKTGNGHIHE